MRRQKKNALITFPFAKIISAVFIENALMNKMRAENFYLI